MVFLLLPVMVGMNIPGHLVNPWFKTAFLSFKSVAIPYDPVKQVLGKVLADLFVESELQEEIVKPYMIPFK
jgi:hypothetical protein